MDIFRGMNYFVRAIELGSLTAVATEQGTSQPTVSKVLGNLEKALGVRLLERSTRGIALTEQGNLFYERAKTVLEEYENAVAIAQGLTERPTGLLRINAPVAFGQFRLNALVQEFLSLYPDISIELILNDRFVDLVEEGVDVAMRIGGTLPLNSIARNIARSPRLLVATPSYLKSRADLHCPADLANHDYIRFAWTPLGDTVELYADNETAVIQTKGRYRVNNAISIRESLAMGAGVGLCPLWLVHDLLESGQLIRVLPRWRATDQALVMLYPSRRYQPVRAKLFINFICKKVLELPGFESALQHDRVRG